MGIQGLCHEILLRKFVLLSAVAHPATRFTVMTRADSPRQRSSVYRLTVPSLGLLRPSLHSYFLKLILCEFHTMYPNPAHFQVAPYLSSPLVTSPQNKFKFKLNQKAKYKQASK